MITNDPPKGCVARELSTRDRQIILAACIKHAGGDKMEADVKTLKKLARIQELLRAEQVQDYYEALENRYKIEIEAWRQSLEDAIKAGKRDYSSKAPRPSPEEIEGPKEVFYLPSPLDAWIKEALMKASFPLVFASAVAKTCAVFNDDEEDEE